MESVGTGCQDIKAWRSSIWHDLGRLRVVCAHGEIKQIFFSLRTGPGRNVWSGCGRAGTLACLPEQPHAISLNSLVSRRLHISCLFMGVQAPLWTASIRYHVFRRCSALSFLLKSVFLAASQSLLSMHRTVITKNSPFSTCLNLEKKVSLGMAADKVWHENPNQEGL